MAAAATLALAAPALAVTATIGSSVQDRDAVDTWANFTVVDRNNPAPFDGYFTQIDYFAEQSGDIRFVVVDAADTVTWISDLVTVTGGGEDTHQIGEPVGVTFGSSLGVYSVGYGVISFDYDAAAANAPFEDYNVGLPVVNETLTYVDSSARYYSMSADIEASSPQICKNGGWESYGYQNQGQCIASVVANDNSGH